MSRHRSARPRYGRIVLALAALVVTAFSVLGGVGVIPTAPSAAEGERLAAAIKPSSSPSETATLEPASVGPERPGRGRGGDRPGSPAGRLRPGSPDRVQRGGPTGLAGAARTSSVRRTYLVSGSVVDNLDPGRYSVYSKSRWAVGVDDSGVMEYFVRFAHGRGGGHRLPHHPDQARHRAPEPCPARHPAVARLHPAGQGRRHLVVELRPRGHHRRRDLSRLYHPRGFGDTPGQLPWCPDGTHPQGLRCRLRAHRQPRADARPAAGPAAQADTDADDQRRPPPWRRPPLPRPRPSRATATACA